MYNIPSSSMAETLPAGSKVFVQPADSFSRNDIVIFNYYGNDYSQPPDENMRFPQHWEKRIYRLVAITGDEIAIRNGELFINKRRIALPPKALMQYEIKAKVMLDDLPEREYNLPSSYRRSGDTIIYSVQLTSEEATSYAGRSPAVINVQQIVSPPSISDTVFARSSGNDNWSTDHYGPFRIPVPGETIKIHQGNFKMFKNIPGIKEGEFLITEKLYFVLGDNRQASEDSRYIGLISHSNMVGVVK